MRIQWIVSILSNLVSMALLVVVMGQYQLMNMQKQSEEKLRMETQRLANQHVSEDLLKVTMEKLLAEGNKAMAELEAEVAKLQPELEVKRKQVEACQAEKITSNEELAVTQKEHTDTEASLKTESDAWHQEIQTLKGQLTEYRAVCDYVKKVPLALNLCGVTPSPSTPGGKT